MSGGRDCAAHHDQAHAILSFPLLDPAGDHPQHAQLESITFVFSVERELKTEVPAFGQQPRLGHWLLAATLSAVDQGHFAAIGGDPPIPALSGKQNWRYTVRQPIRI